MSDDKCPTCTGPVEKRLVQAVKYKKSGKEVIKQYAYRSTAAEQLEKVERGFLALQLTSEKQLADKERELEAATNMHRIADGLLKAKVQQLTAANAVVEAAREVVDICGWDDELQTTGVPLTGLTNAVTKLRNQLRELQGGGKG